MSEDRSLAPGDIFLLTRLWPLTKSFRWVLVLGIVMITMAAFVSLILPYITKVAIDRYIMPMGRIFHLESFNDIPDNLKGKLQDNFLKDSGETKIFILPPDKTSYLEPLQDKKLAALGLLDPERYYLKALSANSEEPNFIAKLSQAEKKKVIIYPKYMIIAEKDLASFSGGPLLVLREADIKGLSQMAIFFGFMMILGYIFDLGQRVIMEVGAQKLGHNLRQKLLDHLFTLSQSFFDRQEAGRLTSRLTTDINNINSLVKSTAASFFSDILSLIGITLVMFTLSVKLAVAALILTPVAALLSWHFSRVARILQRDMRSQLAAINQMFSETMGGIRIIKAFRREHHSMKIFDELNYQNYLVGYRQLKSVAIFLPLVDLCATVVLALIIWFGGLGVMDGAVSLGVLAAFIGYTNRFFIPIKDLAEKVNTFQSAFASLERILALQNVNEVVAPDTGLAPRSPGGEVEFRNVSFRYNDDLPWVLKDLSFTINKGETVALVGSTGSGKSSLINLMLRFYDPQKGSILFDGMDLATIKLDSHRHRIGLVTQDVYLFAGSIMDNLRLGRSDLPEESIINAARAVGADRIIENLPKGYQELIGPEGRSLSSGERQLIACARALIEAPEFVILDEATAFVDSETELLIENAMNTLFKGRTSIIIAHRLSTIRQADRIMVLNRGLLAESGTHDQLVKQGGLYYHLASLQGLLPNSC